MSPLANIAIDFLKYEANADDDIIHFDVVCDENPFVKFGWNSITEQGSLPEPSDRPSRLTRPRFLGYWFAQD